MERLPVEMKVEVFVRLGYAERKTCRRVCVQWRNIIDDVVGCHGWTLTQSNMSRLFQSNVFTRASLVRIRASPAVTRWSFCPFSPIFLKAIHLNTAISANNWNLLMSWCKSLEELVFSFRGKKNFFPRSQFNVETQPMVENLASISHPNLQKLVFRNFIETDVKRILGLLDTFICPKLKQCIISVGNRMRLFQLADKIRLVLIALAERNPNIRSVSFCNNHLSKGDFLGEMQQRDLKQIMVDICECNLEDWKPLAAILNYEINTLCGNVTCEKFSTVIPEILKNSFLALSSLKLNLTDKNGSINCSPLAEFSKLNFLECTGGCGVSLESMNMISSTVTILSLNIPLSSQNITDILQFTELIRLELLYDLGSTGFSFSKELHKKAVDHPSLQLMILTHKNFKNWTKFKATEKLQDKGWTELKSIDGKTCLRAVAFHHRMSDEAWKWAWQNFQ